MWAPLTDAPRNEVFAIPREKQLSEKRKNCLMSVAWTEFNMEKVKSPAIGNLVRSQQIIESLPALDLTRKSALGNWPETHAMQINCELLLDISLTNNLQFKTFAFCWWFVVFPSSSPVRSDIPIDRRMNNWFSLIFGVFGVQWSGWIDGSLRPARSLIGASFVGWFTWNRRKFNRRLSLNFAIYLPALLARLHLPSSSFDFCRLANTDMDNLPKENLSSVHATLIGPHEHVAGRAIRNAFRIVFERRNKIYSEKFPRFWTCKFVDLRRAHIAIHISISTAGPPKTNRSTGKLRSYFSSSIDVLVRAIEKLIFCVTKSFSSS